MERTRIACRKRTRKDLKKQCTNLASLTFKIFNTRTTKHRIIDKAQMVTSSDVYADALREAAHWCSALFLGCVIAQTAH